MPKVPEYVSSQQVPGSAPFNEASPAILAGPARLATEGARSVEDTGLLAQRHLQYIEAEKRRQQTRDMVANGLLQATKEINDAETKMQLGYNDPTTGDRIAPIGAKDYLAKWNENFNTIKINALQAAGDDTTAKIALGIGLKQFEELHGSKASHYANTLAIKEAHATDTNQANAAAGLAAIAKDPLERDTIINGYRANLFMKTGVFTADEIATRDKNFTNHAQLEYMRYKLLTDPLGFQIANDKGEFKDVDPVAKAQALNHSVTMLKAQADERKRVHEANRQIFINERFAPDMNNGAVPAAEMEQIKNGTHQWILSTEYPHWKKLWDNPPDGTGNQEIRSLRDSYLSNVTNYPTLQYIQHYRELTVGLMKELGVQNKEVTTFLEELKRDASTARSGDAQAITQGLRKLEAGLKAEKEGAIGIRIYDNMLKSQFDNMDGEARGLVIADPKNVDKVLTDMRQKYKDVLNKRKDTTPGKLDKVNIP